MNMPINLCYHCFPDYQELGWVESGLIIPILTSLIATGIVLLITEVIIPWIKYSKLAGDYNIYWIKDSDKGGDEIDLEKPMGDAKISYKSKNKLEIIHKQTKHDTSYEPIDHQWKGTLIMETSHYGTVTFHYITLSGKSLKSNKHRLGFKKVIYDNKREGKKIIYLIGDRNENYGKEVLIEKTK